MPITDHASYPPTMQLFIQHWSDVNAFLTPDALLLPGAFTRANFITLKTSLETDTTLFNQKNNTLMQQRENVLDQKKVLMQNLELFRYAVLAQIPGSLYARTMPILPHFSNAQSKFLKPFDEAAFLWGQINANPPTGFTPPLVLSDDTQLTDFQARIANLRTAFSTLGNDEGILKLALETRNALFPAARLRMKEYRTAVRAYVPPGNPLLNSIPRLSPVAGSTPKAVTSLLYVVNATTNMAKVTFLPSTSKNLTRYDLRYSPDTKYNAQDEVTIATISAEGPYEFDFLLSMIEPNATGLFKVYVFNQTSNHHASRVLKIKRPAARALAEPASPNITMRIAA